MTSKTLGNLTDADTLDGTEQVYVVQTSNSRKTTAQAVADLGTSQDNMTDGTTNKNYTATEKTKLAGIASGATANTGTVTSAALSVPTGLSVSGSPITTSGTFAITYASGYEGFTTALKTLVNSAVQPADVRELLTANRTYYVATTGSDSNDGLTSGTAFATPQKAVTTAFATLDLNGYNVTIQLADGTYTSTVTQTSPQVGAGTIKLRGNTTTPGNVLFSLAAQTAISIDGYGTALSVEGIKLSFSGNGTGLNVTNGAYLTVTGNMDFGPALWHMRVDGLSTFKFAANYTISGGAQRHYFVGTNSKIDASLRTVTLTGTPNFSGAFAYAELGGVVFGVIMTFSGSATGSRYQAKDGGIINSGGGGASYFPGSTAGTGTNMGASPYGLYL